MLKNILANEDGQGMVEYGVILGFIAVAAIAVVVLIGPKVEGFFQKANTALDGAPAE